MRPLCFRAYIATLVAVFVSGAASLTAAVQPGEHHQLSANSRHLTASSQPTFGISSLHAATLANGTGATSLTGNLTGIKPGLPATCYAQPCSASVCYPAATVSVAQYVNYVNVTATVEFERQYNISTCADVTSSSCEVKVNGTASLKHIWQANSTKYKIRLQMEEVGLSQLWWTPTDCSGVVTWVLLSNITYDITPPSLALLTILGSTNKTVATSQNASTTPNWAYSDSGVQRRLRHYTRRLQFFGVKSASTYGANVVFSFSEPVTGFAEQYAFVKGGSVSGLNETVAGQQYSTTVVADSTSTSSMLIMVTGSTYSDLAGNTGSGDLNATVTASVLSTASTDGSTSSTSSKTRSQRGAIAGAVIAGVVLAVLLCCCARRCLQRRGREHALDEQAPASVTDAAFATESAKSVVKPDQLQVNASAATSVPLRVRFGTGTPTAAVPTVFSNPMNPTLAPTRSELPLSTLGGGGRSTDEEDNQSADQNMSGLSRTEGEVARDSELGSQPSGPLIHDPSMAFGSVADGSDSNGTNVEDNVGASHPSRGALHSHSLAFGSGSYEGHIMSYNSIVAAQPSGVVQQQETGAVTPRARPMSRLAVASAPSSLPHATTQAGSRAWGDVPLVDEE